MLNDRSVQTASTPINIFKNKGNVDAMFDSAQHFFALSAMSNDLFKRPRHLVQQSVERMLKQILKPFQMGLMHMRKVSK